MRDAESCEAPQAINGNCENEQNIHGRDAVSPSHRMVVARFGPAGGDDWVDEVDVERSSLVEKILNWFK